jgi:hypothetical protein
MREMVGYQQKCKTDDVTTGNVDGGTLYTYAMMQISQGQSTMGVDF